MLLITLLSFLGLDRGEACGVDLIIYDLVDFYLLIARSAISLLQ